MRVTGPFIVQSGLTSLDGVPEGACFASVTGIGDYFFQYKLQPRSADDLVVSENVDACLPAETGDDACDDGLDNDRNGFSDCGDFQCVQTAAHCIVDTDIVSLQKSGADGSTIRLENVLVVARSSNGKSIWLQDPASAPGENNGLYVFDGGGIAPEAVVGALLKVEGQVIEFDIDSDDDSEETTDGTLTELKSPKIEILEGLQVPEISTVELAVAKTEPFESVLVEVANLKIVEILEKGLLATDGTTQVQLDPFITPIEGAAVDSCFSIIGVMDYNTFSDPDGASLIVQKATASTGCL